MASAELDMIVSMLRQAPLFGRDDIPALRAQMEAFAGNAQLPEDVAFETTSMGGVAAEWAVPAGAPADAAILYLHGGGYVMGSVRTHRGIVSGIARVAGVRVLSLDYRLAPEHPYPAAVEDAVAAYRGLRGSGLAPQRLGIGGDSAGGGLTVATLLALRDAGDALPAAALCISPWLDLTLSGVSMQSKADVDPMIQRERLAPLAAVYAGTADLRSAGISPLFADLAGLPEFLVHVGTAETLLDDSLRFVERLRAAGVEVSLDAYDDMIHVWHAFAAILPEGRDAIGRIGDYFRARLLS